MKMRKNWITPDDDAEMKELTNRICDVLEEIEPDPRNALDALYAISKAILLRMVGENS